VTPCGICRTTSGRTRWNGPSFGPQPHIRNPPLDLPGGSHLLGENRSGGSRHRGGPYRLPLERLAPEAAGVASAGAFGQAAAEGRSSRPPRARTGGPPGRPRREWARNQTLEFCVLHRLPRSGGAVDNRDQRKVASAAGEDVDRTGNRDSAHPGTEPALFERSGTRLPPLNNQPQGYYVQVLGLLRVLSDRADGGRWSGSPRPTTPWRMARGSWRTRPPSQNSRSACPSRMRRGGSARSPENLAGRGADHLPRSSSLHRLEPGLWLSFPAGAKGVRPRMVDLVRPMAAFSSCRSGQDIDRCAS